MYIIYILAVVLTLYFVYAWLNKYSEVVLVQSDIDERHYLIRRGTTKSSEYLKQSANTLAEINGRVTKLIEHLEQSFKHDPSVNFIIAKLGENYHPSILSEAAIDNRYTTFTIDKQDMHICLRTRDAKEKIYDINTLMYVILHELAHLCNYDRKGNPVHGHGEEFRRVFRFLVVEGIKIGIYEYQDYTKKQEEYCGIYISSSILPSHLMI